MEDIENLLRLRGHDLSKLKRSLHKINVKVMALENELSMKRAKLHVAKEHKVKWKKAYKELSLMTIDLTSQVKNLKEELEYKVNQAKVKGIQMGFKIFH